MNGSDLSIGDEWRASRLEPITFPLDPSFYAQDARSNIIIPSKLWYIPVIGGSLVVISIVVFGILGGIQPHWFTSAVGTIDPISWSFGKVLAVVTILVASVWVGVFSAGIGVHRLRRKGVKPEGIIEVKELADKVDLKSEAVKRLKGRQGIFIQQENEQLYSLVIKHPQLSESVLIGHPELIDEEDLVDVFREDIQLDLRVSAFLEMRYVTGGHRGYELVESPK